MFIPVAETPEQSLLTEIANEAHIDSWKDLRWFAIGGDNPRSIVVVTRGKKAQTVKTISKTNNPELWLSWQPVLTELKEKKQRTNKKRINHDSLPIGEVVKTNHKPSAMQYDTKG